MSARAKRAVLRTIKAHRKRRYADGGGLLEQGNIDLNNRPVVHNDDGTISTVRSIGANIDGQETLLPTVYGQSILSNDDAVRLYRMSGKHLGKFDTPQNSDAYAKSLHESQEQMYRGYADGGTPEKPAFDPTQPFDAVAEKPAFDPTKPFEPAEAPAAAPAAAAPPPPVTPPAPPRVPSLPGDETAESYTPADTERMQGSTAYKALTNVPHSAYEFGKNTIEPILHPVDTATNLGNLGLGVLEKAGIKSGSEHTQYADAVGKFFADRYGGIENARKTLETDPVGMLGDLSILLTGGGSAAARVPGIVGKVGEVTRSVGRVADPLNAVAPVAGAVARGAGRAGAEYLGLTTGTGPLAVREAAASGYEGGQAGQGFRRNMRNVAEPEEVVSEARGALDQIRHERGDSYRTDMARDVNPDPNVLNFNKIDAAVTKAQGVKTYSGRSGTGPTQNLSPETAGIRKKMEDAITNWRNLDPADFHTPEGIDKLKQQLGEMRDNTQIGSPERVAANQIYNAVRQTIVDQVPKYAKIMKGYEQASKQIKEIETTLTGKPGASIDTALRKLQSGLRNNVNANFGQREKLVRYLADHGAPHLMAKLAGQSMNSWTPRGLGRFVAAADPVAIGALLLHGAPMAALGAAAAIPTMSPRLMGEVVHGTARAARRIAPVVSNSVRPSRVLGESLPYGNVPPSPYQ